MSSTVQQHYDTHLASYYDWIFGGWKTKLEENRHFFEAHHIVPAGSGRALDLGCGSGFQSVPLAEAGFHVTAVDISRELLLQLRERMGTLTITPINADIMMFLQQQQKPYELCVCMGDTLPHLPDKETVQQLFHEIFRALDDSGICILAFRDYSQPLTGVDRFIPVRSDSSTIFTCFLEYEEKYVVVHDLVYRNIDGAWKLSTSCYRKIRLSAEWIIERLQDVGFTVDVQQMHRGMNTLIARKKTG